MRIALTATSTVNECGVQKGYKLSYCLCFPAPALSLASFAPHSRSRNAAYFLDRGMPSHKRVVLRTSHKHSDHRLCVTFPSPCSFTSLDWNVVALVSFGLGCECLIAGSPPLLEWLEVMANPRCGEFDAILLPTIKIVVEPHTNFKRTNPFLWNRAVSLNPIVG